MMDKLYKVFTHSLVMVLLYLNVPFASADIAIITHPGVKEIGLNRAELASIYLGKKKEYSNGESIKAVDLPKESIAHRIFYKVILKKSQKEINRYWSKIKYTGKGKPPKKLTTAKEVVRWVANTEGAIGYVDGKYLNKSVKVVLIIR